MAERGILVLWLSQAFRLGLAESRRAGLARSVLVQETDS